MLMSAAVSLLHAVPFGLVLGRVAGVKTPWGVPAVALVVFLIRPMVGRFGRKFPWGRRCYGAGISLVWLWAGKNFLAPADDRFFAVVILLGALVGASAWEPVKGALRGVCGALLLGWLGWLAWESEHLGLAVGFALGLGAVAVRPGRAWSDWLGLSWVEALPLVLGVATLGGLACFRYAPPDVSAGEVARQMGIRIVSSEDTDHWSWRGSPDFMFGLELCEPGHWLVGQTSHPGGGLLEVRRDRGLSGVRHRRPSRPSNNAVRDCGERRFYLGDEGERTVVAFDEQDFREPLWSAGVGGQPPRMVQLFDSGRWLVALRDTIFQLAVVEAGESLGKVGEQSPRRVFELRTVPSHCFFEPVPGQLWSLAWYDERRLGLALELFALSGEAPRRLGRNDLPWEAWGGVAVLGEEPDAWTKAFPPGKRGSFCAYDAKRRAVWLVESADGALQLVSLVSGLIEETVKLAPGIVFVQVGGGGNTVAVSNYLTGDLTFLFAGTGEVLRNVRLGPRARWIQPSEDGRRVTVASSSGVFDVDVPIVSD